MKLKSHSFRDKNQEAKVAMSPYSEQPGETNRYMSIQDNRQTIGQSSYNTPGPLNAASSTTMMHKYRQPLIKSRRKTTRPGLVIKNGKLLISRKKP